MSKPRSQKRRIPDAYIASVTLDGTETEPVKVVVQPCGKPEKAVSFNLGWWQVRELVQQFRNVSVEAETKLQKRIEVIRRAVQ